VPNLVFSSCLYGLVLLLITSLLWFLFGLRTDASQAGEVEGVKLRSYHNWLAQEKDRQAVSRKQMLQEDFDAHVRREIRREVEARVNSHAEKLKSVVQQAR
jgi:hypothetical protein